LQSHNISFWFLLQGMLFGGAEVEMESSNSSAALLGGSFNRLLF